MALGYGWHCSNTLCCNLVDRVATWSTVLQERYFVLKGSTLFYFKDRASANPTGQLNLEGAQVGMCVFVCLLVWLGGEDVRRT